MKENLKVDVIIPVYNCEHYINRCMKSLLVNENYTMNIILVDDGSTDHSGQIIDVYAKKFVNVHAIHKSNGGLSSARNAGMKLITAEYFTFVDPDDWVNENYISSSLSELKKNSVDIMMVPYVRHYNKKEIPNYIFGNKKIIFNKLQTQKNITRRLFGLIDDELQRPLTVDNLSTAWAKFYKTTKFKNYRFTNKEVLYSEDLYFNIQCFLNAESSEYFNNTHYIYFKENRQSIVHTSDANILVEYKNLYNKMYNLININNLDEIYVQALKNRIVINELTILRNITHSNNSCYFKYKKIKDILNDPIYVLAFENFNLKYLPIAYRTFYKYCKYRLAIAVYLMLVIGEHLKTKIKQ